MDISTLLFENKKPMKSYLNSM